jgi:ABC-2 type transport system permease protein
MAKLWAVIKREYLTRVQNKWFVITTLLVPVMLLVMMVLPAYLAMKSRASTSVGNIAILDATGTDLGARVAATLRADTTGAAAPRPQLRVVTAEKLAEAESLATHEAMRKEITGYLVLDQQTVDGKRSRYAGRNASSIPDVERLQSVVRQTVLSDRMTRAGVDPKLVDSLTKVRMTMPAERISDRGRGGSGAGGLILGSVMAVLLYFSIAIYGQNALRGTLEEKTTRVAEVVASSVKPETLLAGKVIGIGAVGFTQQIVWAGMSLWLASQVTPFLTRMNAGARGASAQAAQAAGAAAPTMALGDISAGLIVAFVCFFVLGVTFYTSLFAAMGATVNSEQEAQQAAAPVMFLLVGSFIFFQPVLLNPTGKLAQVLSWLPFSAPIIMPLRMATVSLAWWEIAGSIASVALGCVLAVWLAARIYRVGLLMYGKKPSFRELVRWVRYAH